MRTHPIADIAGLLSLGCFVASFPALSADIAGEWNLVLVPILLVGAVLLALVACALGSRWWLLAAIPPIGWGLFIWMTFPPI